MNTQTQHKKPTVTNSEPQTNTLQVQNFHHWISIMWRTKRSLKGLFCFFLLKGDDVVTLEFIEINFYTEMTVINKGPCFKLKGKKFDFIMKY